MNQRSRERLETCHPLLQSIINRASSLTSMRFEVLQGWRGEDEQNRLFDTGKSKVRWPNSKHNHTEDGLPCSMAVDVAPWSPDPPYIHWNRHNEFRWLAGFIMGVGEPMAREEGYTLRWGGNWDMDGDHTTDNPFVDLPHIELIPR